MLYNARTSSSPRARLLAPLLVLSLSAVACGDDGDDAANVVPTTAGDAATTTTGGGGAGQPTTTELRTERIEDRAGKAIETLASNKNVVEAAAEAGNFDRFFSLVQRAGLTSELVGPGPFTVFAPTNAGVDETFTKQQQDFMERAENQDVLANIIRYHVARQRVALQGLKGEMKIPTMADGELTVTQEDARRLVNGEATVNKVIEASNGVIYSIDNMLVPPGVALK